jgi:hypothetical protein
LQKTSIVSDVVFKKYDSKCHSAMGGIFYLISVNMLILIFLFLQGKEPNASLLGVIHIQNRLTKPKIKTAFNFSLFKM